MKIAYRLVRNALALFGFAMVCSLAVEIKHYIEGRRDASQAEEDLDHSSS